MAALQKAAKAGQVPTRTDSLAILRKAGHQGSPESANLLAYRTEIRAYGRSLAGKRAAAGKKRSRKAKATKAHGKSGRLSSRETLLLRERIAADAAASQLQSPPTYVRWLVDQPGVKLGLKQARSLVYRELRRRRK